LKVWIFAPLGSPMDLTQDHLPKNLDVYVVALTLNCPFEGSVVQACWARARLCHWIVPPKRQI
jgi:hypothetical protein